MLCATIFYVQQQQPATTMVQDTEEEEHSLSKEEGGDGNVSGEEEGVYVCYVGVCMPVAELGFMVKEVVSSYLFC